MNNIPQVELCTCYMLTGGYVPIGLTKSTVLLPAQSMLR